MLIMHKVKLLSITITEFTSVAMRVFLALVLCITNCLSLLVMAISTFFQSFGIGNDCGHNFSVGSKGK